MQLNCKTYRRLAGRSVRVGFVSLELRVRHFYFIYIT